MRWRKVVDRSHVACLRGWTKTAWLCCYRHYIAFGEVGMAGEVRPAPRGQARFKEAAKLGFSVAVVPKANAPKKAIEGLTIHPVDRVEQAMDVVRGLL